MGKVIRINTQDDYYRILGVSPTSDTKEIKKAYRRLAEKYHPDRIRDRPESLQKRYEKRMKFINIAKDVLTNPASRSFYDYKLGYCDSVEVFEEDIEEVEPISLDTGTEEPETQEAHTFDVEIEIYDEESEVMAEVIEIAEVEEMVDLDGSNTSSNGTGDNPPERRTDVAHTDPISTAEEKISRENDKKDDVEVSPRDKIPFWDEEESSFDRRIEFKKLDRVSVKKRIKRKGKQIFVKGKGYRIQVNPVSFYQDDEISLEISASGIKKSELKKEIT